MDPDADADLDTVGPLVLLKRSLDAHRCIERTRWLTEDREEFIRARVDLVTAAVAHALAYQRPHVTQERRIPITELLKQPRGSFDVGEQERHHAAWQARDVPRARLDLGLHPLLAQLSVEEADRHDPVLLRGSEQALTRALAGDIVLERRLVEPRQRVAHVRRVVDREAPASLRVDVGERAVGEAGARASGEFWQRFAPL